MTFLVPLEFADPEIRLGLQMAERGARTSGTPFISFFTPTEMLALACEAGFEKVEHVSAATLAQRYFAGRTDGLRPPSNSEELLVADLTAAISIEQSRERPRRRPCAHDSRSRLPNTKPHPQPLGGCVRTRYLRCHVMDALPTDPATRGPLPAYRAKVAAGELAPDPSQQLAAERLQALWATLRGYDPPPRPANGGGLLGACCAANHRRGAARTGRTACTWSARSGRGKSMLMDLFFAAADVPRKQRIHFHRFMQNVHTRFHAFKQRPIRRSTIRSRRLPIRSPPRPRCCASTNSR